MASIARSADATGPELLSVPDAAGTIKHVDPLDVGGGPPGRLAHVRLGRRVLIKRSDLEAFIDGHTVAAS